MERPTVYVVDDEEQICSLLQRILAREGYDVRAFPAAPDALAAVRDAPPDLLVTDLMMPGMSGLELIAAARPHAPQMGTIVITGYASIDTVVGALRSGVDDFVTKPFSVAEIRGVAARLIERARAPAEPEPVAASGIRRPDDTPAAVARRLTEMSLSERLHALLAEDVDSRGLLLRAADVLRGALDAAAALLLAPAGPEGALHVHGAPWAARAAEGDPCDVPACVAAAASEAPLALDAADASALFAHGGAAVAAALSPRAAASPDAGVLVVARRPGAPAFDAEALRRLALAAGALGDVFRALRTAERAEEAYLETLTAVVTATEGRSPWFARHAERVRALAVRLGREMGLAERDLVVLESASRVLDLGRVGIPDELLAKPGRPSRDEWQVLRGHVAAGDAMLRPVGRLRRVKPVVRHHHENWDGTGYPDGLRGDEIPYLAALVRVVDAYAALTAPRAWRAALSDTEARARIRDLAGRHFHPELARVFVERCPADGTP